MTREEFNPKPGDQIVCVNASNPYASGLTEGRVYSVIPLLEYELSDTVRVKADHSEFAGYYKWRFKAYKAEEDFKMNGQIQVELQEVMGSDSSIANAAWTSTYDKDRREDKYDDPEKVKGLVPRLIRDGHAVPLESVVLRFWYRFPLFIDREHMTHRIASHNGLSGRYRTMPDDFYGVQGDIMEVLGKIRDEDWARMVSNRYNDLCVQSNIFYRDILRRGKEAEKSGVITNDEFKRLRETIRGPLPIAGMVERTSIFNLRSFANYYRLRSAPVAAREMQLVANMMLAEVEKHKVAPIAIAALKEALWII